jgi:hypothetical protein
MSDADDLIKRLTVAFWGSDIKANALNLAKQVAEIVEPVIRAQVAEEKKKESSGAKTTGPIKVPWMVPEEPPVTKSWIDSQYQRTAEGTFTTEGATGVQGASGSPAYVTAEEVEAMIVSALLAQRTEFGAIWAGASAQQRRQMFADLRVKVAQAEAEYDKLTGLYGGGDVPVADEAMGSAKAFRQVLVWIDEATDA